MTDFNKLFFTSDAIVNINNYPKLKISHNDYEQTLKYLIDNPMVDMASYNLKKDLVINNLGFITPFSLKNGTLDSKKNIIAPIRA